MALCCHTASKSGEARVTEIFIDMGGTFTDGVLIHDDGRVTVGKSESIPSDPSSAILGCIARLAAECQIEIEELLGQTGTILIGTTLATNCILESKGAKCCLIHTKGFRDVFELGRTIPKTDIYNLKVDAPKVLIPRYLRFGVEERLQFDGAVITPLNEDDVRAAGQKAKLHGVEVPVVSFLHSYINPAHEERAAEILREDFPNVVVSSHIVRRWIEYDRTSTATFAAYVKPMLNRFVGALDDKLSKADFRGTVLFSTGLGSVATAELCLENPGHLIGSGLAMGALMGQSLARAAGFENVVTCDMGGTSVDIGVLKDQSISTTTESITGDQKNAIESMDIPSIGAGGGAIAWIDNTGVLRVGPASAGASPGPACYGKGGIKPTLTDANVTLGYIPTDYFLGGDMKLDSRLARQALDTIARPLSMDAVEAAYSVSTLAEALMAEQIFLTIVEKGYDPRDFVFVAAGGAGPVHAIATAHRLGIRNVYVPKHSAVFSALGGATADYGRVFNRFFYQRDDLAKLEDLTCIFRSLHQEAVAVLARQGVAPENMAFVRGAEMRYFGQLRDIEVALPEIGTPADFGVDDFKELVRHFHERHEAMYGWANPKLPATLAMLKVRAIGRRRPYQPSELPLSRIDASAALKRQRPVYFDGAGFRDTPCYDGNALQRGNTVMGPAIIEERRTSIVVPEGWQVQVDPFGNYLASLQ